MAEATGANQERRRQVLEKLKQIHAEAMAKLASLRKRQLELYRRVTSRLDSQAAVDAAKAVKNFDNDPSDK